MSSNKFNTLDEYLNSLEPEKAHTIKKVIDCILDSFPALEVKIAWNVPQICSGKDYVFGVSALKKHLALAPWSTDVMEENKVQLESAGYIVKKNLFQIPIDWQLDKALLNTLVKGRLKELN